MSKKKITLEEAKEVLGSDKVFYNGTKKFNILDVGKYNSGITIEVPQEWNIDKKRNPESPINYVEARALTDGMNIDFDGTASVLFGKYRLSKNGRPVFELTEPTKAKDVMIEVSWGGAFEKSRGQDNRYAEEVGATFFTRRSSNGGGAGHDYWILPVDFVMDMEPRDVSGILANIEQKENERIAEIDEYIEHEDLEIKNSIENRSRVLEQITPIIQSIKELDSEFECFTDHDSFKYRSPMTGLTQTRRYTDNLIEEISGILEYEQNTKNARDTYKPMFEEMECVLKTLNINITYCKTHASIRAPKSYIVCNHFKYDQEGYNSFINEITKYQEREAREQEEARRKADELKRIAELKNKKEKAKEMGYPEVFEFENRKGGATGLSHAYVIESDGTIREPDYNNLHNRNHKFRYQDWKNDADGVQGYEQLFPGEIIVSYTKSCTSQPFIFNVEWADGDITEEQIDTIYDELDEKADFADTVDGTEITHLEKWARAAVKAKAEECKKQLISIRNNQDNSFAEEIVDLAEEAVIAKEKNAQARQLAKEYEEQLEKQGNNQSLDND